MYPHFLFNGDPHLRIPPLAREINEGMGAFTVDQVEERIGSLEDQPVLLLGIAYRADVREDAFSSAFRLRDELVAAGARVYAHDPYFSDDHLRERGFEPFSLDDPQPVRVAIVQAPHAVYRDLDPAALPGLELLVDGRNALERDRWTAAKRRLPWHRPLTHGPDAGRRAGGGARGVGRHPDLRRARQRGPISTAMLAALPQANAADRRRRFARRDGQLADEIAAREPRVAVLHRTGKEGLGAAYRDGVPLGARPAGDAGGGPDGRRLQP